MAQQRCKLIQLLHALTGQRPLGIRRTQPDPTDVDGTSTETWLGQLHKRARSWNFQLCRCMRSARVSPHTSRLGKQAEARRTRELWPRAMIAELTPRLCRTAFKQDWIPRRSQSAQPALDVQASACSLTFAGQVGLRMWRRQPVDLESLHEMRQSSTRGPHF